MRALLTVPFLTLALLAAAPAARAAGETGAFAFVLAAIEGGPLPLSRFAGHPVLVVNTASQCGYTYQYEALERLWRRYRGRGLVVVGVPSNDFGDQEPGGNAEIKTFCESTFDVDFPLAEKVHVVGPEAHPLFAWLRERLGPGAGPRWNFHKYLIAPDGSAVASWPSATEPEAPDLTAAVERLLPPGS
jgi:glutathione peroxidase